MHPDPPRSLALPEITHVEPELTSESTVGAAWLGPEHHQARIGSVIERLSVEVPIEGRRWYVGGTYLMAVGQAPSYGPLRVIPGNFELQGRGLWAETSGLAFGGGMGVMLPTAAFDQNGPTGQAAAVATALRGWDYAFFQPGYVALRPFIDVRWLAGDLVVQFRQGINWGFRVKHMGTNSLEGNTSIYAGYRVSEKLGVGLEVIEHYFIDAPMLDSKRTRVFVSPMVRLMTPFLQPALSIYGGFGSMPNLPVEATWGVRVAFTFLLPSAVAP